MQNFNIRMGFVCRLKAFCFNDLPLVSYGIVCCILAMVAWLREMNILQFLGFPYVTIEQVLLRHALLYQGLFQALMFTPVFTYKIEFYGQFILVSGIQSDTAGNAVKILGLETCQIAGKSTSRVKDTENISFVEVLFQWTMYQKQNFDN